MSDLIKPKNKKFDLNIEKILEHWSIRHAIREIIANALDETIMIDSDVKPRIYKENNNWIIRDFGRGLQYLHLTQKENNDKINHKKVIGKFGVGLKDAIATLFRGNIKLKIVSSHLNIEDYEMSSKSNFDDIKTIHLHGNNLKNNDFKGTKFIFENLQDKDVEEAKKFFLNFSEHVVLAENSYGQIIEKEVGELSNIYINGLKVSTEENFAFHYNILSIDKKIKKGLNRERMNLNRSIYSERIQKIILHSIKESNIYERFFENYIDEEQNNYEELKWSNVLLEIIKQMNLKGEYVFVTQKIIRQNNSIITDIGNSDKRIIVVDEPIYQKITNEKDENDEYLTSFDNFIEEQRNNIEYDCVDIDDLSWHEREIFVSGKIIIDYFGNDKISFDCIQIANKIKIPFEDRMPLGLSLREENKILILRSQLKSKKQFYATLSHEIIHFITGFADNTREFENELSRVIGDLFYRLIDD